jgi:hypothetical protein
MILLGFYNLNPELFKEDVNKDLVEKAIIKTTAILESRSSIYQPSYIPISYSKRKAKGKS